MSRAREMHRGRQLGMSFWPFVVSLLLLAVFVLMWFSVSGERDNAKKQAEQAQAKADAAEKKLQEEVRKNQTASAVVGFLSGGNTTDLETVNAQMKEYGPKIRDLTTVEFPTKRFTPSPDGGSGVAAGETIKVSYLTDAELADTATVQAWLSKFETALTRMRNDLVRTVAERGQAIDDKEKAAKQYEENLREKDAGSARIAQEKQNAENAAHEKEAELNDKIARLTQDKEKAEGDLTAAQKVASENETKLLAQVGDARSTIKTLTQREAPTLSEGPDGEVVVAGEGMAIVNRGKSNFLMPGTVFDVLGHEKGGRLYKKGTIKVTSTDADTSRAAVLEETRANDPIQKGDLIQSLTYSPNRKLHFVLVGDFKRMGRSQVEAQLVRLGAIVDPKVTAETNYVVQGSGENLDESAPVKAAKDLGITVITEDALGSFTRF